MTPRRIVLGSSSPRRRRMLEEAGWDVVVRPPSIDDGRLDPGACDPRSWTLAMAWLKARAVAEDPRTVSGELLLAADTVCSVDNAVLGQPEDREDAGRMLRLMRGRSHRVWTGMCLMRVGARRRLDAAMSHVQLGEVGDSTIEAYLDSGAWRGKAGGYNLSDRIDARWPLTCDGEGETVMGLSMRLLDDLLQEVDA